MKLKPIGPDGRLYIRHFLDLDGLSVRDLCFQGEDLLILAGPTMPIAWPISIYRWQNARQRGTGDCFWWQADEPEAAPESARLALAAEQPLDPPASRKADRPEALAALGGERFLIICDAPSTHRLDAAGLLTAAEITLSTA